MHRFYFPNDQIKDNKITITGSDVNHIKNVLRLKPGDKIKVFDSSQNTYLCKLDELSRDLIKASIVSCEKGSVESRIDVTLAQCLPKGKKMDLIIKMAVELGVNTIIPVISERSIPKIEGKEEKKIMHWQTIAKEAAEQSGRSVVPKIMPLVKIGQLDPKGYDLALMPWEGEKALTLKNVLTGSRANGRTGKLLILIGPEGGFSKKEAEKAKGSGFKLVSLGKRILRCETAATAALSQIYYQLED